MKVCIYQRVSTTKQGIKGLGMEAQKSMIENYLKTQSDAVIIGEFVEVESGRKNKRPELLKALELCRKENATLIVAKLDRLSRNASFLLALRDSNADFVCCDMPQASRLTIGIMALMAENEAKLISDRTKAALKELKRQGVELGSPENLTESAKAKGKAVRVSNAIEESRQAAYVIENERAKGLPYHKVATKLNAMNYKTRRGGQFSATQVQRIEKRIKQGLYENV